MISHNKAEASDGGVYCCLKFPHERSVLEGAEISHNSVLSGGGGVYVEVPNAANGAQVILHNLTLRSNTVHSSSTANAGSAVHFQNTGASVNLSLLNSTIAGHVYLSAVYAELP